MATNFRISVHRKSEDLYLKLMGNFDGTSAHELLNLLKRYGNRTARIFIHTSSQRNIYPFGVNVFHNDLDVLNGRSLTLVFTGEHASRLAPEEPIPSGLTISTIPLVAQSGTPISGLSLTKTGQKMGGFHRLTDGKEHVLTRQRDRHKPLNE